MRSKILKILIIFLTIIAMLQACVPSTDQTKNYSNPTVGNPKTSTKNSTNRNIYTETPQSTPTNTFFALGTVSVNLCNLREGPGTDYAIIDYSEKGSVHKIFGTNSERTWLLLDREKSIWIALTLVSLDTNISDIPIINNLSSLDKFEPTEKSNQQPVVTPTQFLGEPETAQSTCPNGCTYHPPGCDIKGNISYTSGERIYHVPGGEFYDECTINPEYGERWFCTESEALANGWRKSYK